MIPFEPILRLITCSRRLVCHTSACISSQRHSMIYPLMNNQESINHLFAAISLSHQCMYLFLKAFLSSVTSMAAISSIKKYSVVAATSTPPACEMISLARFSVQNTFLLYVASVCMCAYVYMRVSLWCYGLRDEKGRSKGRKVS